MGLQDRWYMGTDTIGKRFEHDPKRCYRAKNGINRNILSIPIVIIPDEVKDRKIIVISGGKKYVHDKDWNRIGE